MLVPTVLIGGYYALLNHLDLSVVLVDKFKAGYWFTFALFEYYVIHDCVKFVAHGKQRICDVMLAVTAVICYVVAMPTFQRFYDGSVVAHALGIPQLKYFVFFVMGIFVRRHSVFVKSERSGLLILLSFIAVYGYNAVLQPSLSGMLFNINLLLEQSLIVLLVYYMFCTNQHLFCSHTRVGRLMCLVGTNTLEIYLLHYFILPRHLEAIFPVEVLIDNPLIALFVITIVATLVIGVVLVVCSVLRGNRIVSRLLWNK